MSLNILHQGIGTGCGLPFSLVEGLKVTAGNQANFTAFNKLAARTAIQGQVDLAQPGHRPVGVFVDCSPKGDSCTVETEGFEWVAYSGANPAVGDTVTVAAGGLVALVAAGTGLNAACTLAEIRQGIWQVDQVNTTDKQVLINICAC